MRRPLGPVPPSFGGFGVVDGIGGERSGSSGLGGKE